MVQNDAAFAEPSLLEILYDAHIRSGLRLHASQLLECVVETVLTHPNMEVHSKLLVLERLSEVSLQKSSQSIRDFRDRLDSNGICLDGEDGAMLDYALFRSGDLTPLVTNRERLLQWQRNEDDVPRSLLMRAIHALRVFGTPDDIELLVRGSGLPRAPESFITTAIASIGSRHYVAGTNLGILLSAGPPLNELLSYLAVSATGRLYGFVMKRVRMANAEAIEFSDAVLPPKPDAYYPLLRAEADRLETCLNHDSVAVRVLGVRALTKLHLPKGEVLSRLGPKLLTWKERALLPPEEYVLRLLDVYRGNSGQ